MHDELILDPSRPLLIGRRTERSEKSVDELAVGASSLAQHVFFGHGQVLSAVAHGVAEAPIGAAGDGGDAEQHPFGPVHHIVHPLLFPLLGVEHDPLVRPGRAVGAVVGSPEPLQEGAPQVADVFAQNLDSSVLACQHDLIVDQCSNGLLLSVLAHFVVVRYQLPQATLHHASGKGTRHSDAIP